MTHPTNYLANFYRGAWHTLPNIRKTNMTYITTQHQFTLDERHPADVFDEMSNFFSLYTVAQNSLQQMSVQLTAPANFDIDNKPKLAKAYQQFTKAVKYSIPDSHILPIQYSDRLQAGELQLMLQHNDMNAVLEGEPMPFYQKVLGVFLPKFEANTSETGLYPEQSPIQALPVPQPLPQTASQTASQPVPQPVPPSQPTPQPAVQVSTPANAPPQPVPMPSQPMFQQIQPSVQPATSQPPVQSVTASAIPVKPILPKLPKTTVSIKPYRELLTQAIVAQAQHEGGGRSITQITLKSSDSLTTAVIEAIFASFHAETPNRAYDAIDMVSYGLEELRPALARIGVSLAEDTQFALNAKAKATPQDFAQLTAGQVNGDSIKIGVTPQYGNGKNEPSAPASPSIASRPAQNPSSQNSSSQSTQPSQALPTDNSNSLNITINVHVSDDMGERTVKARHFPINFTTQMQTDGHSIKLAITKSAINKQTGRLFSVVENQGNLAIAMISPAIQLVKSGKVIQNGAVLLPNDVLELGNCRIRFSVGN